MIDLAMSSLASPRVAFAEGTDPVSPPGFIFWGLFLVFAFIVLGYLLWMLSTERKERNQEGP